MRHLMSPLDFSVEELDKLLNLADDIGKNPKSMRIPVMIKGLRHCFLRTKYTYTFKLRSSHDESWRKGSHFLLLIPAPHPKAEALPILFALFPVMQISVLCVIRRKVLRL